ncbi:amino acid permease [Thermohalobacter berrensis]|uniref:Amino acid permease n=1 Tax=Thermohalobacter berrensis TaxID=99594 RepID=A0A419SV92_9FIRM|nr:amino acid permease [Thermohalobacter berrensis]RKD29133.1 amino acid permease [Thermohalobacter berrensis]
MEKRDKGLSPWQLTMLALGTVVGGSFFLGSAIAIRSAGPSILLGYILVGGLVYLILFALSEMTVADTVEGSFRTFAERAFGSGVGFVVGWIYWTGLILAMSSEAIAVSVFLRVWFPQISIPLLGTIIIITITLLNLLGADKLSKLESGLAAVKLLAIVGFIVLALALIFGIFPGRDAIGIGVLDNESILPEGLPGLAGSLLIVMFTYAGFEIIGLASTEAYDPHRTIPRAILYTVLGLVGLYTLAIGFLLPLIPTSYLNEEVSPLVAALKVNGIYWAANIINVVLVTAILSTMLAATFGLGRMMRSLADEGYAPLFLRDKGDIPYKGIIFSGLAMLIGLGLGFILPKKIYLFLVSSGGFSLLFTYLIILATHYKFRKKHGCPPKGKCQLPGYPYTSWIAITAVLTIIITMPLIPGQGEGLFAGLIFVTLYATIYLVAKYIKKYSANFHRR